MLAARPKTLTGAAVPVMIGLSLAFADVGSSFKILPAVLCLLFALVMQVDANFINDYFDFIRGNDDEARLGPRRACAQGWVSPRQMVCGIAVTTAIACAIGLPLIIYGGVEMLLIWCVVCAFLFPLHYVSVISRTWRFTRACVLRHCSGMHRILSSGGNCYF